MPRYKPMFFVYAAIVASVINVVMFYNIEYPKSQMPGVPFGWDTPHYVSLINHLKQTGDFYQILKKQDNVNFMYYFTASIFPFDAIRTEIYLPILLIIISIISLGFFTHKLTNQPVDQSLSYVLLAFVVVILNLVHRMRLIMGHENLKIS